MRETSIDVQAQLKALRLNGMATAWADLTEQGGDTTLAASRWLVEHLLQAEDADRAMRSITQRHHRDSRGHSNKASAPRIHGGTICCQVVIAQGPHR